MSAEVQHRRSRSRTWAWKGNQKLGAKSFFFYLQCRCCCSYHCNLYKYSQLLYWDLLSRWYEDRTSTKRDLLAKVPLVILYGSSHELGGNAVRGASRTRDLRSRSKRATQTEVNQFDVANFSILYGLCEHDIFGFQITKYEIGLVQVRQSRKSLSHDLCRIWLRESLLNAQAFQQSATGTNIHDQVYVAAILIAFVGFANMCMVQLAENIKLIFDGFWVRYLLFGDGLHGNIGCHGNGLCTNVSGSAYNTETATAQLFQHLIVVLHMHAAIRNGWATFTLIVVRAGLASLAAQLGFKASDIALHMTPTDVLQLALLHLSMHVR